MKLDAKAIRYLTSEDFRVLQGVLIAPPPRAPALDDLLPSLLTCCLNIRWKPEVETMRLSRHLWYPSSLAYAVAVAFTVPSRTWPKRTWSPRWKMPNVHPLVDRSMCSLIPRLLICLRPVRWWLSAHLRRTRLFGTKRAPKAEMRILCWKPDWRWQGIRYCRCCAQHWSATNPQNSPSWSYFVPNC